MAVQLRDSDGTVRLRGDITGAPYLVGPFSVSFNTPGFMNPGDNGVATVAIPSGAIVTKTFAITTAEFVGADVGDAIAFALLVTANGSGPTLAYYSGDAFLTPYAGVANPESLPFVDSDAVKGAAAVALADCHIFAAYYPNAAPPTAGSLDVYALVVTP